jgi:hypothetical protein
LHLKYNAWSHVDLHPGRSQLDRRVLDQTSPIVPDGAVQVFNSVNLGGSDFPMTVPVLLPGLYCYVLPPSQEQHCVDNRLSGLFSMADADAGEIFGQGAGGNGVCGQNSDFKPVYACWQSRCGDSVHSFSVSASSPKQAFTIDLPIPPAGGTGCYETLFTDSYAANCTTNCVSATPRGLPPNDANIVMKYRQGTPDPQWSSSEQQQRLTIAEITLSVGGVGLSLLAVKGLAFAGNPILGLLTSLLGLDLGLAAAQDPPDPNYTTVVTPAPPNIDVSGLPAATAQLVQAEAQALGFVTAILTTTRCGSRRRFPLVAIATRRTARV